MSTKVDLSSNVEPHQGQSTAPISVSSSVSASSPKVSMFGAKAGFVIPKNKLSGSLVPIFRGGSKVDAASIVKEDRTKQVQRKTRWGADLTQDPIVRKGKALAYQTRVEQITQQLKSGSLEFEDDQGSVSPKHASSATSVSNDVDNKSRKVELLELERRELIGEILRLNPSYKAPPDYKPLLKESKVSIPIKIYSGYNFVGLLLGPESNTQKRLEEETGAKVRVFGTKSGLGEKREITKSDISEAQDAYDDLYVHVSADTYEKVDTAVALIELLLTPVSGNAGVTPKVASSSPGNNEEVQTKNLDSSDFLMTPVTNVVQAVPQPSLPVQPGQPPFQPYPPPWFSATTPNVPTYPSAFMPPFLSNNPTQFPLLRPPPGMPQYFTQPPNILSVPRTTPAVLRSPSPTQLPPNQSPSGPISQPLTSGPVAVLRPHELVNPQIGPPIRPLITPATSSGWPPARNAPPAGPSMNQMAPPSNSTMKPLAVSSTPPAGPSQFNVSDNVARPPAASFAPHSTPLFSTRPSTSSPIFLPAPSQTGLVPTPGMTPSFSGLSMPPPSPTPGSLVSPAPAPAPRSASFPQRAPSAPAPPSPLIVRAPIPAPTPSRAQGPIPLQLRLQPPQPLPAISTPNSATIPSFSPSTNSPIGASPVTTPKPLRPISGDFTFQPLRTQPPSSPNTPASHASVAQNSLQVPFAAPKAPSFQPAFQSPVPAPLVPSSPRLQHIQHQPLPSETSVLRTGPLTSFPASASNIRLPSPMLQGYPSLNPVQPVAPAITVGSPSFPRAAQAPNPSGSMPSYSANFQQGHQNQLSHVISRPGGSFTLPNQQLGAKPIGFTAGNMDSTPGGNQIYDPFSPTASAPPRHQGASNPVNTNKPETDAEYEDLMASVGVK